MRQLPRVEAGMDARGSALIALVVTAVVATGLQGSPAEAAPPRLTPWNNALVTSITVGPQRDVYSLRIIGAGRHAMTEQEVRGAPGQLAAAYDIEIAPGSRAWRLGHPRWTGVVLRARMDAQRTSFVETRLPDHARSVGRLTHRVRALLAVEPHEVAHAVGGDWSQIGREGRAREEASDVANAIADEVARNAEAAGDTSRTGSPAWSDPALLDLADRATVRAWQRANHVQGVRHGSTWTSGLVAESRGQLHAGHEGPTQTIRYHRSVVVRGTADGWTMTLTDQDDDYAVTWTGGGAGAPVFSG